MKKTSKKDLIYNLIFILIITVFILAFIFRGEDKASILGILKSVDYRYILVGSLLSLGFIFGEAISLKVLLRVFNYDHSLLRTIKYAFTGFFFSSVTPSSTGGQPMQVYEMKKDNIEIYHSSIILLIELMVYQVVTLIYALTGLVWAKSINLIQSKVLYGFIIVGVLLNLVSIIFINLSIFNPTVSNKIYKFISFIIGKLPMKEEKQIRLIKGLKYQIEEYNKCSKYIKRNKLALLKVFFFTIFQLGSNLGVSYVVYKALGGNGRTMIEIILIQSLIYIGSSYIPLPGSVGVSESTFIYIQKHIFKSPVK